MGRSSPYSGLVEDYHPDDSDNALDPDESTQATAHVKSSNEGEERYQYVDYSASDCRSVVSASTYYSAVSQLGLRKERVVVGQLREEDEYAKLLRSQQLWPVDPMIEQNWSGRGQHARFEKDEQKLINEILEPLENLGSTKTAIVQSVRCRRILLARKTIFCGKQTMTKEEAIAEVAHLTRLDHAHVVRVIGTYIKGRELSILLYPVAQHNLESYFEEYLKLTEDSGQAWCMEISSLDFYSCLSSAVRYIHSNRIKHMDIKPRNILVRRSARWHYHVLIADFGIARSYATSEDIETSGKTSFTKRYAAPEVVKQDLRGLPADIFSLGCVFVEIYSTFRWRGYCTGIIQELLESNDMGDTSYQANIHALQPLLGRLCRMYDPGDREVITIIQMLNFEPDDRPTTVDLVHEFKGLDCCTAGSIQLEVMDRDTP